VQLQNAGFVMTADDLVNLRFLQTGFRPVLWTQWVVFWRPMVSLQREGLMVYRKKSKIYGQKLMF